MRSPRTAMKSSPHSPQLEKSECSNEDPVQPKKKKKKQRPLCRTKKFQHKDLLKQLIAISVIEKCCQRNNFYMLASRMAYVPPYTFSIP